eukprot:scaffold936_cov106-Amphora_coffeaeformis.AAC.15
MPMKTLREYVRQQLCLWKSNNSNDSWTVDCDTNAVRYAISISFAGTDTVRGEPTWEWGLQHYVGGVGIADKIAVTRFIMSFPLFQDLRSNSFQVCSTCPRTDEITSFASVREYDTAAEQAKWCKWLRQGWHTMVDLLTLFLYHRESLPRLFTDKKYRADTRRLEQKFDKFEEKIDAWHQQILPSSTAGLHWYVHMVGVNPAHQGKGQGKALMGQLNKLADASNRVMYLEAGEPNRVFYEKMGFRVQRTEYFVDPLDHSKEVDPFPLHLMTRHPNNSS